MICICFCSLLSNVLWGKNGYVLYFNAVLCVQVSASEKQLTHGSFYTSKNIFFLNFSVTIDHILSTFILRHQESYLLQIPFIKTRIKSPVHKTFHCHDICVQQQLIGLFVKHLQMGSLKSLKKALVKLFQYVQKKVNLIRLQHQTIQRMLQQQCYKVRRKIFVDLLNVCQNIFLQSIIGKQARNYG